MTRWSTLIALPPAAENPERFEPPAAQVHAEYARRAHRLAAPVVDAGRARDAVPVLVFRLGQQLCGVDLADVAEVVAAIPIASVPGAPPHMAGVFPLRGEIRPVLNIRSMLGLAPPNAPAAYLVVLRLSSSWAAVAADQVESVRLVSAAEVAPADGENGSAPSPYIRGWTRDSVLLLNTAALGSNLFRRSPPERQKF